MALTESGLLYVKQAGLGLAALASTSLAAPLCTTERVTQTQKPSSITIDNNYMIGVNSRREKLLLQLRFDMRKEHFSGILSATYNPQQILERLGKKEAPIEQIVFQEHNVYFNVSVQPALSRESMAVRMEAIQIDPIQELFSVDAYVPNEFPVVEVMTFWNPSAKGAVYREGSLIPRQFTEPNPPGIPLEIIHLPK